MSSGSPSNRFQKRRVATEVTFAAATREGDPEPIHAPLPRTENPACRRRNPDPSAHPSAFAPEHGTTGQDAGILAEAIPGLRPRSPRPDPFQESSTRVSRTLETRSALAPIGGKASYQNHRISAVPSSGRTAAQPFSVSRKNCASPMRSILWLATAIIAS